MIKLENVTKYYYGSSNVTCALRKINLEFKIGEFVAITGESGSGKTTLLNIISGFDTYEEGEIYFNNKMTSYFDENDWELYRKNEISFIFQNYNLIDSYTVLQNVAMTYVIDGYSYKEAKVKAIEKIKLVGLEKDLNKKAVKLSGGQKQRLAIARALAKETNIIVADEPTGNLDEKNGELVLDILKKVSKDKLVLVVTHNISQIEPYITRKVRLHDGEVVVDEIREKINNSLIVQNKTKEEGNNLYKACNFSFLNLITQPLKSLLMLSLVILCTLSSFVFYGNFKANLDENKTKEINNEIFQNADDTRLLVRTSDFSVITDEIMNKAKVENVLSIEKYDGVTDINYYRPDDYKFIISSDLENPTSSNYIDYSYYELIDHSHFMRSSSSLTEDMLVAGRLPQNDFEMVVYSDDLSILDTTETVLFHNEQTMGINVNYNYDVKIVGILKEKTKQAYFSDYICKVLDLTRYNLVINIYFEKDGVIRTGRPVNVVIDPSLKENELAIGKDLSPYLKFNKRTGNNLYVSVLGYNFSFNLDFNKEYTMKISDNTVGVSRKVFDEIYSIFKDRKQFAAYIDDYANTDDVINELNENQLIAISCFRSSSVGYNNEKLIMRYVNLGVSIVGLIVINIITMLLLFSVLKLKRNDYLIFKFNGLTNKLSYTINYIDVVIYGIISNVILIAVANVVKINTNNDLIIEIFKRIKFYDYILIFIVIMITMIMTGRKFSSYLTKYTKISAMRED